MYCGGNGTWSTPGEKASVFRTSPSLTITQPSPAMSCMSCHKFDPKNMRTFNTSQLLHLIGAADQLLNGVYHPAQNRSRAKCYHPTAHGCGCDAVDTRNNTVCTHSWILQVRAGCSCAVRTTHHSSSISSS